MLTKSYFYAAACLLFGGISTSNLFAADLTRVVKRVSPAVVVIEGAVDGGRASGTGFLLSRDGKIATNFHVIRDLAEPRVGLASGEKFNRFTVVAYDEVRDLAVIKIPGFNLPAVRLGDSDNVVPGQTIATIGNPRGLEQSVTAGIVSAVRDHPSGAGYKVIQIDAAINPGNSGGPVVSSSGDVIGIAVSRIKDSEGLNFAIPVNYLKGLLADKQISMSLEEFQARFQRPKAQVATARVSAVVPEPQPASPKPPEFTERWKSLSSGNIFLVRRFPDRLVVERQIPDEERQYGEHSMGELVKRGDSTYSGSVNAASYCFPEGVRVTPRLCPHSIEYSVNVVASDRIELTFSGPGQTNCVTCEVMNTATGTAIWIPASSQDRPTTRLRARLENSRAASEQAKQQRDAACRAAIANMQSSCANSQNAFMCGVAQGNAREACQ